MKDPITTIVRLGFAFIVILMLLILGEAIGDARVQQKEEVLYDQNADGAVDLIDVSIAIDNLNHTIEEAKLNKEYDPWNNITEPLPYE
jgi:hypothetical protein